MRPGWRYTKLDLEVRVDPLANTIRVEGHGHLAHHGNRPEHLTLVLGDSALFTLTELEANDGDHALEVDLDADAVTAGIRTPRSSETARTIDIRFTAHAATDSLLRGDVILVPWSLGWYPVPDAELKDDRDLRIAGTITFHLPPGWLAITNGEQQEPAASDSSTSMTWNADLPTERSFCAGPYREHKFLFSDRPVNVFLLSQVHDDGESQARGLMRALTDLESCFGPYPYPTPSLVEFPEHQEWWHASASHGFVMAETGAFLHSGANLPLFAHEVAHAWWGNLVRGTGPGSLFCSESLAQYGAFLAVEALRDDREAADFLRWSSSGYTAYDCARGYFALVLQELDRPLSELGHTLLDFRLAYSKGPSVLRMLRRRVGDEVFFEVLRALIDDHRESTLSLDVFRARFVEAAPAEAELETFFAQWLDREGAPVLEMHWETAPDSSGIALTIDQVQDGDPFSLWLELGVLSDTGVSIHPVKISQPLTKAILPVQGQVEMVVLDPRHYLLIWDPEYGVRAVRSGQERD